MNRKLAAILQIGLALLAGSGAQVAHADKIITRSGQTLEGVIKDENAFNVRLDNRGNIISIPKARIKDVVRISLDDNVRMLMERATEALGRADVTTARTYVEQARTLSTTNQAVVSEIEKMNARIQEMEIRGGTPEERRLRAEALVLRAKEAYDMIQPGEGNNMLLRALQLDPTYERAHEMINQQLSKSDPDPLLAASYFTQVMWPDNVKMDSPVIKMLPQVYAALAQLFAESNDAERSKTYAQLMRKFSEAFAQHANWKEAGDEKVKAVLEPSVDDLLASILQESIDKRQYDLSLRKMQGLMVPDSNATVAKLFLRAQIGSGHYDDALALLDQVTPKFPEEIVFKQQYNSLKLLIKGQQVEKTDKAAAISCYETIYSIRESLVPELGDQVGVLLAQLKGPDMDAAAAAGQFARAADIAAIMMQYGSDPAMRRHAAQVMIANLQRVPWKFEFIWKINGKPVSLPQDALQAAQEQLRPGLAVQFDPTSPFLLRITVDGATKASTAEVVQSLSNGQPLSKPAALDSFKFSLQALHPTLGTIYATSWQSKDVPDAATPFKPKAAAPAPKKGDAKPGEAAAAPTPAPTPAEAAPAEGGDGKPKKKAAPKGPLLAVDSMDMIKSFVGTKEGLPAYVFLWNKATLLPSHLFVPMAQEILKEE